MYGIISGGVLEIELWVSYLFSCLEKSDATHLTARGTIQQGQRLFHSLRQLGY